MAANGKVIFVHSMEAQGMWRYTSLLTAALGGGEWSVSVDGRISPDNKAPETNEEYS